MNSPKKTTSIAARPSLWLVLALVSGGMIATVQWQHPQALALAGGLVGVSALLLAISAFFFGKGSSASGSGKSLVTRGLDSSLDGYLVTGANGEFLYSNPYFHKLLSFAASADAAHKVLSTEWMQSKLHV